MTDKTFIDPQKFIGDYKSVEMARIAAPEGSPKNYWYWAGSKGSIVIRLVTDRALAPTRTAGMDFLKVINTVPPVSAGVWPQEASEDPDRVKEMCRF